MAHVTKFTFDRETIKSAALAVAKNTDMLPAATLVTGLLIVGTCPSLEVCGTAVLAAGVIGCYASSCLIDNAPARRDGKRRLSRVVSMLTPIVGLASFGALYKTDMALYRAHQEAASLFDAAKRDCANAKGQTTRIGDKLVCLYFDPAKPGGGSVVFVKPAPNP